MYIAGASWLRRWWWSRWWTRPTAWFWSVRLWLSGAAGRAARWLLSGLQVPALTVLLPVVAVWKLDFEAWQALLLYAAILLIWAAWRAHGRVVIEAFEDFTAVDQPPEAEEGKERPAEAKPRKDASVAVMLANRLAEMRYLYDFVDDPERTPTPNKPLGATVQLDDAATALRDAVTTESTVAVGPIAVPLGAVMALLGRFVRAPRLRGAIHGDATQLIVTAELTIEGQGYSWRVPWKLEDAALGEADVRRRRLEEVIDRELAYQVFSDLTLQRQARWPATKYWLDALRNVADCQRRPRRRLLLLKEAESNFRKALAEDERFYLAGLNLGIVYRRIAEHYEDVLEDAGGDERRRAERRVQEYSLASRQVLQRAVGMRPDRWEAYHALAEAFHTARNAEGTLEMIAGLCDRAIGCKPSDRAAIARIQDLKGWAQEQSAVVLERATGSRTRALSAAARTRRGACRAALGELGRAKLFQVRGAQRRRLEALQNQAAQCLVNLAWTTWERRRARIGGSGWWASLRLWWSFRGVYAICRLATRISDINALAHHRLALIALAAHRRRAARRELSAAARIDPEHAPSVAKLARVLAESGDRIRAIEACAHAERVVDFGSSDQKDAQDDLAAAYDVVDPDWAGALRERALLRYDMRVAGGSVDGLKALLASYDDERDWEKARIRTEIGRLIRDAPDLEPEARGLEADGYFAAALAGTEGEEHDPRVAELHYHRSKALALQPGRAGEALAQAEIAVTRSPLKAAYRTALAEAHEAGRDLDHACTAADDALLLAPNDPDLHYRAAKLRWRLAETLACPEAHRVERVKATDEFGKALELYESDQPAERRTAHWWLARSLFALSRFADAVPHLRFVLGSLAIDGTVAVAGHGVRATTRLWLAMTYRKLQRYGEAELHARLAADDAALLQETGVHLATNLTDAVDDNRWPLGLVRAQAEMQLGGSHADRSGDLAAAQGHLGEAYEALTSTGEAVASGSVAARMLEEAWADYHAETGRVLLALPNPRDAIKAFKASTNLDPGEADVYLLLARAHVLAAQRLREVDWQEHARHARDACRRTREIGGEDHPDSRRADELERVLEAMEQATPIAPPDPDGNGHPGLVLVH